MHERAFKNRVVGWVEHPEKDGKCYTKCWGVPKVDLLPENEDVWTYYQMVESQVIVAGFGTIVGVRHDAFFKVLEVFGVRQPLRIRDLFMRFLIIEGAASKVRAENAEIERKKIK